MPRNLVPQQGKRSACHANGDAEDSDADEARNRAARQSPRNSRISGEALHREASAAERATISGIFSGAGTLSGRLVELNQIPQALGVLRREIDQNPDDPGLYERLAVFLQQNKLGAEQEEVYRRAMARFPDRSWYNKLARYLFALTKERGVRETDTQDAVKQFDGSDLQGYFQSVVGGSPQMYLRLNQYANARFPHNPYFVRNLLRAYHSTPTCE